MQRKSAGLAWLAYGAIAVMALGLAHAPAAASGSDGKQEASCRNPDKAGLDAKLAQIKGMRQAAHDSFIAASKACKGASTCLKQARQTAAAKYQQLDEEQQAALAWFYFNASPEEWCRHEKPPD
jgi:hypothetical protein